MPLELENLEVKIPQDSYTLCNWGTAMNNCVATFIQPCLTRRTIILGFFNKDTGKIVANAEITNNNIRQLYGVNNGKLSKDLDAKIRSFLSVNIINYKEPKIENLFGLI